MTTTEPQLVVGDRVVPTQLADEFLADERRATSFITNFGDWQLPADAAAAMRSPVVHLEWFHDTGELVAFGQVPRLGHGDIEVSPAQAAGAALGPLVGGAGGRVVHAADGSVREWFPAMVVDSGTVIAVLAVIAHGPAVHERLWGWHLEHRHDDGWAWLSERLADGEPQS